jgi:DNA-binding NtrC family response regulator
MAMPGLSGDATLQELKSIDASVPVLGSSGFSADEARTRFGDAIAGFLPKPYTLQRLSEVVLAATSGKHSRATSA